jgi:hypothetical protein
MAFKAKGMRGSWYAEVDGVLYPCVHKHWWIHKHGIYHDPYIPRNTERPEYRAKYLEILHAMKRVVLADSGKPPAFVRKSYIGLFEIDDIDTSNGLTFRITKRVA